MKFVYISAAITFDQKQETELDFRSCMGIMQWNLHPELDQLWYCKIPAFVWSDILMDAIEEQINKAADISSFKLESINIQCHSVDPSRWNNSSNAEYTAKWDYVGEEIESNALEY